MSYPLHDLSAPTPEPEHEDEDATPAAICGETALGDLIGGADKPLPTAPFDDTSAFGTFAFSGEEQPPFPADDLLPSDDLKPSEKE